MPDQVTRSLRIGFESDNGVITLTSDADTVFDHFRQMLEKVLGDNDLSVEWHDGNGDHCDVRIKLVQLDQGRSSLRSFLHWVPLMSPVVCLFPVTFEVEVTVTQNGSRPQDFLYVERHRNAAVNSVMMLQVCSKRIAARICRDICSICK